MSPGPVVRESPQSRIAGGERGPFVRYSEKFKAKMVRRMLAPEAMSAVGYWAHRNPRLSYRPTGAYPYRYDARAYRGS